jgi:chromosome segregation ATPase
VPDTKPKYHLHYASAIEAPSHAVWHAFNSPSLLLPDLKRCSQSGVAQRAGKMEALKAEAVDKERRLDGLHAAAASTLADHRRLAHAVDALGRDVSQHARALAEAEAAVATGAAVRRSVAEGVDAHLAAARQQVAEMERTLQARTRLHCMIWSQKRRSLEAVPSLRHIQVQRRSTFVMHWRYTQKGDSSNLNLQIPTVQAQNADLQRKVEAAERQAATLQARCAGAETARREHAAAADAQAAALQKHFTATHRDLQDQVRMPSGLLAPPKQDVPGSIDIVFSNVLAGNSAARRKIRIVEVLRY